MLRRRYVVGLVVSALAIGYVLGPPIAGAVGTLVTIEGANTGNQAEVTQGARLRVDTEAVVSDGLLGVFSPPERFEVIGSGEGVDFTFDQDGVLVAVLLEVPCCPNEAATITDGTGQLLWTGGKGFAGHFFDVLGRGIPFTRPLVLDVGAEGESTRYILYGYPTE